MFNNSADAPSLILAQRPALLDKDDIADLAFIGRVMGHVFYPTADELAVQLMTDFSFYKDDNALIHAVADNRTLLSPSGRFYLAHSLQSSGCLCFTRPVSVAGLLIHDGLNPCNILAELRQTGWIFQPPDSVLEPELEIILAEILLLFPEILGTHVT